MPTSVMEDPVATEGESAEPGTALLDYFGRVVDRLCRPSNPLAATLMRDVRGFGVVPLSDSDERDLHLIDVQSDAPAIPKS